MRYLNVPPDGGESFWQPEPANGHVEIKISAKQIPGCPFSMGTQTIPPGSFVREHAHAEQYESIVVLSGQGTARIDGRSFPMAAGVTLAIAPGVPHRFTNDGDTDLKFQWTISPGGLEEFFAEIGRPRLAGEPRPAPFERPTGSLVDGRHRIDTPAQ